MGKDILKIAKEKSKKKNYLDRVKDVELAINYKDLRKRYEFIYDTVCNILDDKFKNKNFCDFKNDKCIANRKGKSSKKDMGCCYSYLDKGIYYKELGLCEYMKERKCTQKCISCKFFVCEYLKKQGICFNPNDFLVIELFFNKKQKEIIQYNFFRTKEEIINKLIEKNNVPYFIYVLLGKYLIKNK